MKKRIRTFLIVLLGICLLAGCGMSVSEVENTNDGETGAEGGSNVDKSIEKKLDVEKPKLQLPPNLQKGKKDEVEPEWFHSELVLNPEDQNLKISYSVENINQQDLTLIFSSGQEYDYEIYNDKNELIYKWSDGKMFTMAIKEKMLASGDKLDFQAEWDYRDKNGALVANGEYLVQFWVTANVQTPDGKNVQTMELQSSSKVQINK